MVSQRDMRARTLRRVSVQVALASTATLVALAFALSTLERWRDGGRRHDLAWTVALGLFVLGAFFLWLGAADGWSRAVFRPFYLFGAVLDVPFLALGTVYLLAGPRTGDRAAVAVALAACFAAGVVLAAPVHHHIRPDRLPQGSQVFGALPRVLAAVASGGGALVVFGGAAWSARRHRRGPRLWANVLIAAGTLILSASGLLNSVLDEMEAFAVTLAVGISVVYAGFLVATADGGAAPSRPDPPAGRRPR